MPVPDRLTVAVVGLGYVGLPLAVRFGLAGAQVIGFDIDGSKIAELRRGIDRTGEVDSEDLARSGLRLTDSATDLPNASFIVIAVPTPVTPAKQPDLSAVEGAAATVGRFIREGTIVVLESTVYPGVTEEVVGPTIERTSGLKVGVDFFLAYSPERANPGDREHTVDKVVKIVAAQDADTLETVASVYGMICRAGIYRTPDIRTAEAAKVIENIQRDLNIALVNELSLIFRRLGINTMDVLKAAATKWNFHLYKPGLVGGHCIGVDPYYLTYLAEQTGYHPQIILAGRRVNDAMGEHVADLAIKGLIEAGKIVRQARVLILGLTFKEDVNDTRNSRVKDVINRLQEYGVEVLAHDPLLQAEEVHNGFHVRNIQELSSAPLVDAIILAVPHQLLRTLSLEDLKALMNEPPVLIDVRSALTPREPETANLIYKTL